MSVGVRYDVGEGVTAIDGDVAPLLAGLPSTPVELCAVAQGLVMLPNLAAGFGIPEERQEERSIRAVSDILRVLRQHDDRGVEQTRSASSRVVGTCRHFALLACAFLRHRAIPARCRAGFASYFVPGSFLDHWVVEYRHPVEPRWVRIDPEVLGFEFVAAPDDLAEGEFLTGGEAWIRVREGRADPSTFGVDGYPENFGIGEIRGNLVRDLAALNKVETLPWDEWGRMEASYAGDTGPDYDDLMHIIAATCASDDEAAIAVLYARHDLAVPSGHV
ncbi:MAG: transglutaminase-like domain-containing protein [Acidimicrobiales bacterium]